LTPFEANALREEWTNQGNPHFTVGLEQTDNGYVTGAYICPICGSEVIKIKSD